MARNRRVSLGLVAAIAPVLGAHPATSRAETLYDAVRLAYETNPTLHAQQAQLRATDETVVQAHAGAGLQVNLNGQGGYTGAKVDQPASIFSPARSIYEHGVNGTASVVATQPLYTFGAVRSQVDAATANVASGREDLRQVEAQLLLNVITAYEDVRRDRLTLAIVNDELKSLDAEYRETRARGTIGDLTKTDIAQSAARIAQAKAQLLVAKGQLNIDVANYVNLVGQSPGDLAPPPDLPGLPASADDAFAIADRDNPQLLSAIAAERAADAQVKQAKANFGPTVSLQFSAGVSPEAAYQSNLYSRDVSVAAVVNQPLFTSGLNSSKVRQALENDNRAQYDVEVARRLTVQNVAKAWDQLLSTRNAIEFERRQVDLQTTAVQGNRVEQKVGLRSTIDLLNAELELASAQIALLQSRHDEYVARASVLAALGRLEVHNLAPTIRQYDARAHMKRVQGRFNAPWGGVVEALDSASPAGVRRARAPAPVRAVAVRPAVTGAEPVTED